MPEARAHLPEEWAQQARCPVCSQRPLSVVQSAGQPDRLACPRCETQFEMDLGGQQVRLVQVPPILPAEWAGTWVKAADVQARVRQVAQAARERRTPPPPPAAPATHRHARWLCSVAPWGSVSARASMQRGVRRRGETDLLQGEHASRDASDSEEETERPFAKRARLEPAALGEGRDRKSVV